MSRTGPAPSSSPAGPRRDRLRTAAGASLGEIVRYVTRHTGYSEGRARKAVLEVLAVGMATRQIIKTSRARYALAESAKPEGLNYRIREPRFSDNSSESSESV